MKRYLKNTAFTLLLTFFAASFAPAATAAAMSLNDYLLLLAKTQSQTVSAPTGGNSWLKLLFGDCY